jgi:hypothetical protein
VDGALIRALVPAHKVVTTRDTHPVDPKAVWTDQLTLVCGAITVIVKRVTALRDALTRLGVTDQLTAEAITAIERLTSTLADPNRTDLIRALDLLIGAPVAVVIHIITELNARVAWLSVTDDLTRLPITDERA